jgi:Hypothetical protein (DUF2513)
MKRDMDLIRKIMLAIEKHPSAYAPDKIVVDGYAEEQVGFHIYLMLQSGLIEGIDTTSSESTGPEAIATCLTPSGYDFIDAIRNDTIWSKVKAYIKEKGVSATVEIVQHVALFFVKQQINLP